MVPLTPVVVTLPLTVPSSAMWSEPLPVAEVDTGGTSSAPVSLTAFALLPGIQLGMLFSYVAQDASANAANASAAIFSFMTCLL
jgi:hypothetical protein